MRENDKEIKQSSLELMAAAEVVYLATVDSNGFPQVRAMLNLRNGDNYPGLVDVFDNHDGDFMLYLTTNTSSAKMDQIRASSKATVYFCNPGKFHGLMLAGEIEIITEQKIKNKLWQDGWERYYPSGVDDPDYTILSFQPAFAKGWYKSNTFGLTFGK